MSILMFFAIIILAVLPVCLVREWVKSAAFGGYSKSHIKKIFREYTLFDRISLLPLIKGEGSRRVKRRVILYWLYILFCLCVAVLFALYASGYGSRDVVLSMFFLFMLSGGVFYEIWAYWNKW